MSRTRFNLNILAGLFCEILSFPKFTFSLEPKLLIPSGWPVILFPDFPGAISDSLFVRQSDSMVCCFSSSVSSNIRWGG